MIPSVDFIIQVRVRRLWLLTGLSRIPIPALFKAASRFVRFEWRTEHGRWQLVTTAYDLIDWDRFDGDDDDGEPLPTEASLMAAGFTRLATSMRLQRMAAGYFG